MFISVHIVVIISMAKCVISNHCQKQCVGLTFKCILKLKMYSLSDYALIIHICYH